MFGAAAVGRSRPSPGQPCLRVLCAWGGSWLPVAGGCPHSTVSRPVHVFLSLRVSSLGLFLVGLALILFLRCCENHFIQMPNKPVFWKKCGRSLVPPQLG